MNEHPRLQPLRLAFIRVGSLLAFGALPAALVLAVVLWTLGDANFVFDFHGDLYQAGVAILHGRNPYPTRLLASLAAVARAGGHPSQVLAVPVYPAPALLLSAPLALLPFHAAGLLFTLVSLGAFGLGLYLLEVRDWRCYGAALLSWPLLHTLRLGQVNCLLVLALAIGWRWRARMAPPASAVAAAVVGKLFLWPVALFLLFTRRWRALAMAAVLSVVTVVGSWAVIGFSGFTAYPKLLSNLDTIEGSAGISWRSLAAAMGITPSVGTAAGAVVAAGLVALAWATLRLPDGERRCLGLLVVAGITSSTLVWPHYLTLLFVPIALLTPRLGPLWFLPLMAYLAPVELTQGQAWKIVPYTTIELVVVAALCRPLLRRWVLPRRLRAAGHPPGGEKAAGRLAPGLESTSSRSYTAAQRPTKGPKVPY